MEKVIRSLDLETSIGMVTLTDGTQLAIPKLSMSKLIKLVKFIGMDLARLYFKFQDIINDSELDEMDKFLTIMDSLSEQQLMHGFSILLDISDEEALNLDLNEMLDVLIVYSEKVDFNRTFLQARTLAMKVLGREIPPTFGEWTQSLVRNMKPQEPSKDPVQEMVGSVSLTT